MRPANRGFGSHSCHKNSFYIILQGVCSVKQKMAKIRDFLRVSAGFYALFCSEKCLSTTSGTGTVWKPNICWSKRDPGFFSINFHEKNVRAMPHNYCYSDHNPTILLQKSARNASGQSTGMILHFYWVNPLEKGGKNRNGKKDRKILKD